MIAPITLIAGLANLAIVQAAVVASSFPVQDKLAPANATWTAKFIKDVPVLPLSGPTGLPAPDLTLGKQTCKGSKVFGMTFDDGPSEATPALLDALKARNIKATFFVVGSRVINFSPNLVRAFQEGHQIGIHTWSHPPLTSVPTEQIIAEILMGAKIVRDAIGVTPTYFRPPFGDADGRITAIAKNMGLTIVNWAIDSGDTSGGNNTANVFKSFITANPNVSPIALSHDLFPAQASQGPAAVDAVTSAGYKIVRIDQCLGATTPTYTDKIWEGLFDFNGKDVLPPSSSDPNGTGVSTRTDSNGTDSSSTRSPSPTAILDIISPNFASAPIAQAGLATSIAATMIIAAFSMMF